MRGVRTNARPKAASLCCVPDRTRAGQLRPTSLRCGGLSAASTQLRLPQCSTSACDKRQLVSLRIQAAETPGRLSRADRLHPMAKLAGLTRTDKHVLPEGPIPGKSDLDLVSSGRQIELLEDPVEVVDYTRVCPVHINLSFIFIRPYLNPDGSGIEALRPITISICSRGGFRRRDRSRCRWRRRPRRWQLRRSCSSRCERLPLG